MKKSIFAVCCLLASLAFVLHSLKNPYSIVSHIKNNKVQIDGYSFTPRFISLKGVKNSEVKVEISEFKNTIETQWIPIKIKKGKSEEVWMYDRSPKRPPFFVAYYSWEEKLEIKIFEYDLTLKNPPAGKVEEFSIGFQKNDETWLSFDVNYPGVHEAWHSLGANEKPVFDHAEKVQTSFRVFGYEVKPEKMDLEALAGASGSTHTSKDGRWSIFHLGTGANAENEYWIYDHKTKKAPKYLGYFTLRQGTVTWHGNEIFSLTSGHLGYRFSIFYSTKDLSKSAEISDWLDVDAERAVYVSSDSGEKTQGAYILTVGKLFDAGAKEEFTIPLPPAQIGCVGCGKKAKIIGDHVDFEFEGEDHGKTFRKSYFPKLLKTTKN